MHWLQALGLQAMQSVLVEHCKHSFGLSITAAAGWKFVFSGDTQLCPALVEAAAGATLLVHEATFESGMDDEAMFKKHSTISDALQVCPRLLPPPKGGCLFLTSRSFVYTNETCNSDQLRYSMLHPGPFCPIPPLIAIAAEFGLSSSALPASGVPGSHRTKTPVSTLGRSPNTGPTLN